MPLEIEGDRTVVVGTIAARARAARTRIAADGRRVSDRKVEIASDGATRIATYKPVAIGRVAGCRRTAHWAVARVTKNKATCP